MACNINKIHKQWKKKVDDLFDKMGDALSRADEKLTNKVNQATGKKFRNFFAVHDVEKVFSDWIREYHLQRNAIYEKAKDTREFLSELSQDDSADLVRALNGDKDPYTLSQDLKGMYDGLRKMIDDNARELVDLGVLKEQYAIKDYLKRYYKEYIDGISSAKLYFTKRFKERKNLTHDERIALGMLEDASFVIPNTIAEQRIQALKAQILKSIADRFAVDELQDGYTKISDETMGGGVHKYGALAGKFVPIEIAKALKDVQLAKNEINTAEAIISAIHATVDHIKVNVTVKNPATHIYNVLSNVGMAFLHEDLSSVANVLWMASKKTHEFKTLLSEAKKYGMNTMLNDMDIKVSLDPITKKPNIMMSLIKNLYMSADSKSGQMARSVYKWEDQIFKLAAFYKNMKQMRKELGRTLNENEKRKAFREANEAYVDYETPLPNMIREVDKLGVMPFLHYTWKSTPVVAKAIAKNPMRFVMLQIALVGLGASAWFNQDDDVKKPDWAANQLNLVGAKEWVDLGNGKFLNAGRMVPAVKFGQLDFTGGFVGGILDILQGQTPLGYTIGNVGDNKAQTIFKRGAALAENYAPPLSAIGRYGQRVERKLLGKGKKNASTGEEMSYGEIVQQPLGLRKFDAKKEAQKKANAIKNKYTREIENGEDKVKSAQEYRENSKKLRATAAKNGIYGLNLDDAPPHKEESGFGVGKIRVLPRLKL